MLRIVHSLLAQRKWAMMIVDESHNLRYSRSNSKNDAAQVAACISMLRNVPHMALLSGTPSLSRPFDLYAQVHVIRPSLFGTSRFQYGSIYCLSHVERLLVEKHGSTNGWIRLNERFQGGVRLQELHVLLTEAVMIRRLKRDVLSELPEKRRQVIRLELTPDDHKQLERVAIAQSKASDDEDEVDTELNTTTHPPREEAAVIGDITRSNPASHLREEVNLGLDKTEESALVAETVANQAQYHSTLRGLLPKTAYQA